MILATMIRRREASKCELAEAMDLPLAVVSQIGQQCIALRKRRSDCDQVGPSFYVPRKWLHDLH